MRSPGNRPMPSFESTGQARPTTTSKSPAPTRMRGIPLTRSPGVRPAKRRSHDLSMHMAHRKNGRSHDLSARDENDLARNFNADHRAVRISAEVEARGPADFVTLLHASKHAVTS